MTITTEFPEYELSTLPTIPSHWKDISWHNDVCPSWQAGNMQVFIDFEQQEAREYDIDDRFRVCDADDHELLFSSNNWETVLSFVSALEDAQ
jgi:hypothetical protein